jgi:hypothetical protein
MLGAATPGRRLERARAEMTAIRILPRLGLAAMGLALLLGCTKSDDEDPITPTEEVGTRCVPGIENQTAFRGYEFPMVTVDTESPDCEQTACLVNHFQGRVSCPYGQTSEDLGLGDPIDPTDDDPAVLTTAGDWGTRCRVPGTSGRAPEDRIRTEVPPQKLVRRADDAVYCSCRCANSEGGTDDRDDYCECPDGFTCSELIWNPDSGLVDFEGSYCIKNGTEYDYTATSASEECVLPPDGSEGNCGPP